MENNELEEMREQLATLNEKIEKEPIVNDAMIENAVKERLNWFQKKSKRLIIIFAILTPVIFYIRAIYCGLMCLGCVIAFSFIYRKSKEMDMMTYNVAKYITTTKKMIKAIKILKRVLWILGGFIVLAVYLVIYLNHGHSNTVEIVARYAITTIIMIMALSFMYAIIQFFVPEFGVELDNMLKDLKKTEE